MMLKKFLIALLAAAMALGSLCPALADDYDMPYYIEVDITNQIVTIYNTEDMSIARQMLTSSGMNGSTPLGTFHLMENGRASERSEWTWFQQYHCWVKYATRIYYGYMFHSLPFEEKDESTMIAQAASEFGTPTSHGCMRLRVDDARFIAQECLVGTRVKIYESGVVDEELRELLLISSYTGEGGMSYNEFMGRSEDALGRGSSGNEVLDLQYRLSDLGYYDGEFSGVYDVELVAAVKNLQKDLGIAENGISTPELLEVIFSENAPVSAGEIILTEGKSGPVVKKLQTALRTLGMYNGDLDGIYDLDVTEAVRQFQLFCGYEPDGIATPELQSAVYYVINKISGELGSEEFTALPEAEEILLAKVDSEAKVNIRQYADTESEVLGKVSDGDIVTVVELKDEWAEVVAGDLEGYVYAEYLEPFTQTNVVMNYTAPNGASCRLGSTVAEKDSGAQSIAQEHAAYYASAQFMDYSEEKVTFATVSTGSEDLRLNLRAEPSGEAEVLAEIPNGTTMRALEVLDEWTKVGYDAQIGYLMNRYLSFSEGSVDEVESTEVDDPADAESMQMKAVVVAEGKDKEAEVYDAPGEDAQVLCTAKIGLELTVLEIDEGSGWVKVRSGEQMGYMKDVNLSFRLM